MVYRSAQGTYLQLGVASFFSNSSCEAGKPSGFTRVSAYADWIVQQTVMPNPQCGSAPGTASSTHFTLFSLLLSLLLSFTSWKTCLLF